MGRATFAALAIWTLSLLAPAAAPAAPPPLLWQSGESGSGAGQTDLPRGIGVDRSNGHVFVADQFNHRIVEFNPVGEFEKTWGWDVAQSGPADTGVGFEICVPEDGDVCKAGIEGSGAGQFSAPAGVAVDSAGDVYVVDWGANQRVQKFNRAGEFLLAFGGDVVFDGPDDSANDEEQELTLTASSGSFRLGMPNMLVSGSARQETALLPFNAGAAEIEAALNALPTIGGLGGSVSITGTNPYQISFEGKLGGDDVPRLSATLGVGSQLKCSSPTAAETISFQWLRNSNAIEGATASTYTATAADESKSIQCRVTAKNANAASIAVSEPGQVIAPAPFRSGPSHPGSIAAPQASAPLNVGGGGGQTLTCDADKAGWEDLAGIFLYQWYRNGTEIKSAESSTYQVTSADLASPAVFQCEVTAHGFGSQDISTVKESANRATVPAPSAPPAPEAKASTSPQNGVMTVADGGEPEICKPADSCNGGTEGTANGEFGEWPKEPGSFIAIDPTDKVYVGDENRIQRFDTEGVYQGEIPLSEPEVSVQSLATDAAGNLYFVYARVASTIHKLNPAGEPLSPVFAIPKPGPFTDTTPSAIAVNAAGHVFAFGPTTFSGGQLLDPLFEFDAAGNVVNKFGIAEFEGSTGLAANLCAGSEGPGNLFVANASSSNSFVRTYGTPPNGCFKALTGAASNVEETTVTLNGTVNPNGSLSSECRFEYGSSTDYGSIVPCAEPPAAIGEGASPVPVHADISGLEAGTVYHFRLRAKVAGASEKGPDRSFKTLGPPVISDDHTVSVTDTEATLKARVNPEGFPTTYRFEYGLDTSYGQSTDEVAVGSDRSDHLALVHLTGLTPGTSYHWRIVAANSSSEKAGHPTEGEDHVLFTYQPFAADTSCPNQAFRTAASAFLPDCRAYEMVSPVDKNGGDIFGETSGDGNPGGYVQASVDGESITYTTSAAFADTPSSFRFNQYLAARHERGEPNEGWGNHGIRPPVVGQRVDDDIFGLFREFMAFSPDLCSAWLVDHQTPAPTADGQDGYRNLYRRENCGAGAGSFEALIPKPAYELSPGTKNDYVDSKSVQGYSEDSRHAIFAAFSKLNEEASATPGFQIYDRFGDELHLVSVLPNGSAAPGASAVGSGYSSNLDNAVSADGSRIYWTFGKIFLRLHPEQGIVPGECSEEGVACTVQVSADQASFWAAAADGSKALYAEGEDLYEFDLAKHEAEEPPRRLIAHHVEGVTGADEDLGHIYFVSSDDLTPGQKNSEGDEAQAGQPNLYLDEKGALSFAATLAAGDVGAKEPGTNVVAYSLISASPYLRATRVSADGTRIAFESRAPLTGYDNAGADGKLAVEVFSYQAGGSLQCVSCNPSGARPSGVRELEEPYVQPWTFDKNPTKVPAAAWIPTWEHPLQASNVLSQDGNRLFFNSNDALLPRDTNGAMDIYEWEASGAGGCEEADPSYFPQNGGCLYLISTGESPFQSEFWEASPDGRDVFFTTESSLLPQDPGSIDLYDARIGGGFPQPTARPACEGDACQSPVSPPNDPTPASSSFRGPGSSPQGPTKPRCPKGKRQVRRGGKARCVTRAHSKQQKRQADHDRRAAR